jgi:hypothetical protein
VVNRESKVWSLKISFYTLALGVVLCSAQASLFAQTQPTPELLPSASVVPAPDASQAPGSAPISRPASLPITAAASAPAKNFFHIKYVSEGAIYLDAGHNEGLEEGMLLHICHSDPNGGTTDSVRFQGKEPIANVRIFSVADTSAAAEIIKSREDLIAGDIAYLDIDSAHLRQSKSDAVESENYPVVITFSYGDPLDEELRETVAPPQTASPRDQLHGRIGFDYGLLSEPGGISSRQTGLMIEADMNRIRGTHWNFTGYWRGNLTSQNTGNSTGVSPATLNDLLNRTYHLGLYYQNPDSLVTMGVGRLYLPYAPSLSTIDGGYFGYRVTSHITAGVFGGSTPDPSSWSYAPNQNIAGTFVNYEKGDFNHLRFSDTFGLAATSISGHIAREFAFAENTISYSRYFSFYNSMQIDKARTALGGVTYNSGLTQSFSSARFQPVSRLTLSLNDNYLRSLPTFDPALISLGLVDQYLFQGLSGGVHLDLPYHIGVSTDVGKSKNSTDNSPSWNQAYGLTFGELFKTGLTLDMRYTEFNSSFGKGNYQFISLSRTVAERFHVQIQGGLQHLTSAFSTNSDSKFVSSTVDWSIGPRYFFQGLFSWNMGTSMNYQQTNFTFGYRFGGALRK